MNQYKRHYIIALILLAGVLRVSSAASLTGSAEDLDNRMRALSSDLRCLVCQNQALVDSNAPLAIDLRREIRGMMVSGSSDGEIVDFLVNRYGDFVLYRPPLKGATAVLWFGPVMLALISILLFVVALRRRKGIDELSDEDEITEKEDNLSC